MRPQRRRAKPKDCHVPDPESASSQGLLFSTFWFKAPATHVHDIKLRGTNWPQGLLYSKSVMIAKYTQNLHEIVFI